MGNCYRVWLRAVLKLSNINYVRSRFLDDCKSWKGKQSRIFQVCLTTDTRGIYFGYWDQEACGIYDGEFFLSIFWFVLPWYSWICEYFLVFWTSLYRLMCMSSLHWLMPRSITVQNEIDLLTKSHHMLLIFRFLLLGTITAWSLPQWTHQYVWADYRKGLCVGYFEALWVFIFKCTLFPFLPLYAFP